MAELQREGRLFVGETEFLGFRPDGGDFAGAQGDLFAAAIAFSMYPQTGRKSYCDPNWAARVSPCSSSLDAHAEKKA